MFNPLMETQSDPSTIGNDKGSDTSSGIHSDSNSSLTFVCDKTGHAKSNSLESLVQTLQKLEEAAADKPNLRSLSSFKRSINILNKFDTNSYQKPSHVNLTSFATENSIYGTQMDRTYGGQAQPKMMNFVPKPDSCQYFMP